MAEIISIGDKFCIKNCRRIASSFVRDYGQDYGPYCYTHAVMMRDELAAKQQQRLEVNNHV